MRIKQFAPELRPGAALLLLAVIACGGDLTLPDSSAAGLDVQVVRGNGQTGTVGQQLPAPVVVRVQTDAGAPMAGRQVAFQASGGGVGAFDPDTAVTDSRGEALTRWVLGTAPGTYTGAARLVVLNDTTTDAVPFQADAEAGAPDTLRAAGPTSQPGRRGEPLQDPLTVLAVDRFGNPVAGAEVQWKVASDGGGELSEETTSTAADGTASVTWTLGNRVGVQRVEAAVDGASGSPVVFTAVVLF